MTNASHRHHGSNLPSTPERLALLIELWDRFLEALLTIMRASAETGVIPRASTLAVVRAFLVDNGVCGDALSGNRHAEALEKLAEDFAPIDIDDDGKVVRLPTPTPTAD